MRIAMLIARFPPVVGGTEIQCCRLSLWLARNGHEVVVLTERSSPELARRERRDGFEIIRFRTFGHPPWSSFFYGIQAFFWLLRQARFDILHAHMIATPAILAMAASRLKQTPVLIKIAGGRRTGDLDTSRQYWLGRMKLRLLKAANPFVVCPSRETCQEAGALGIPAERLCYIPNGVDTDSFKPAIELKRALRASCRIPEDALVAIYVGRWAKGKGVDTLLDLWEEGVTRSEFRWHLVLVLPEPPPSPMAERIEHLKQRIHTAYGVRDTATWYQASDLAVLLSEGEGLSNFLLEAMACGLPALTTEAAALPDARGEESGTYTVTAGTKAVQEALSFLTRMAGRADDLLRMGRASREHIEKNYSFQKVGSAYLSLYQKMID